MSENSPLVRQWILLRMLASRRFGVTVREMAQTLVKKMLQVPEDATKEQITGEIDKLLADETIKAAIGKLHVDKPPVIGEGSALKRGNDDNGDSMGAKLAKNEIDQVKKCLEFQKHYFPGL